MKNARGVAPPISTSPEVIEPREVAHEKAGEDFFMRCPKCKCASFARRPRAGWMKWIPGLQLLQCDECGCEFCGFRAGIRFVRPSFFMVLCALLGLLILYAIVQTFLPGI